MKLSMSVHRRSGRSMRWLDRSPTFDEHEYGNLGDGEKLDELSCATVWKSATRNNKQNTFPGEQMDK